MYDIVNITPELVLSAQQFVLDNDRNNFLPFFIQAEKFCHEHNVVFGGKIGLDLLVGEPLTIDSYSWDLYCDNPYVIAKQLADELAQVKSIHIPARTVTLQTNIRYKEFTISVFARRLIKIYALDKYRGIKLLELMGPITKEGYFTKLPVLCISGEMQLIDIYRMLYSPARRSEWNSILQSEKIIYNNIKNNIAEKAINIIGGSHSCRLHGEMLTAIKNTDYVLIGDCALESYGLSGNPERLQLITYEPITATEKMFTRALRHLNGKLISVKYELNLPTDFQLTKFTLYLVSNKHQRPLADIYNSSSYELIPWWEGTGKYKKIKIGNPWVVLRFMFIDIWILRILLNMKKSDQIINRIKLITQNTNKLQELAHELISSNLFKIFQLGDYTGWYYSPTVVKSRMIKAQGVYFPIYYPAKNNNCDEKLTTV